MKAGDKGEGSGGEGREAGVGDPRPTPQDSDQPGNPSSPISLRCAHMSFCWFCHGFLECHGKLQVKQ